MSGICFQVVHFNFLYCNCCNCKSIYKICNDLNGGRSPPDCQIHRFENYTNDLNWEGCLEII